MCGIIAYCGNRTDATNIVVEGLKKLEYRGYDSWGFVAKDYSQTDHLVKELGKISDSGNIDLSYDSNLAIAHTRWATHGRVNYENCHPHSSVNGEIHVVMNGIIENFQELKEELIAGGQVFQSETDTEIIPHLVGKYLEFGFEQACKKALARLEGSFAVVIMSSQSNYLFAARNGAPLIIGKGTDEVFIASDITPFIEYTNQVIYLDDNEGVVVNGKTLEFFNLATDSPVEKRVVTIAWDVEAAHKGDFDHFMLKEIMEQKQTIHRAINQDEDSLAEVARLINGGLGTFFIGCGTAGKVCLTGEYFFSQVAHKHVNAVVASEFSSYANFLKDRSLVIAVSQSGETADVMDALQKAKKKGSRIVSLVNVEGSSIYRQSDYPLLINAGPEQAVASTKATTAQLSLILLLAYAVAGRLREGQQLLNDTAGKINDMLNPRYLEHIKKIAQSIFQHENMYIIGKNENYPMALESALKIQEVSYIHAEGFAAGELKHGPIALIHEGVPCLALISNDSAKQDVISACMELKARGAVIIGVAPEKNDVFDYWIRVPDCQVAAPIVNIIPVQILAYYLALLRDKDPDKPRNLAKSVTVK